MFGDEVNKLEFEKTSRYCTVIMSLFWQRPNTKPHNVGTKHHDKVDWEGRWELVGPNTGRYAGFVWLPLSKT